MTPDRTPWPRRQRSLEELDEDVLELQRDIRHVGDRLDSAPFVRVELHNEQLDRVRSDIASLRALTMWTLGLLCSQFVGAIVVVIVSVARGGGS